ncbi:hypothetical protein [Tissierella sp.]|uniref:hypothetical protein n=1 Tax=Tissierella sp. TaxID=41274 RepID=UPI0028559D84|nr:hypothetical protein [Tissierella sp.]MDR7856673.1 hypothetical protein [Tissierella sp.]
MRKYMKYEIKGSYKFILGILSILIIASTIIQMNVSKFVEFDNINTPQNVTGFKGLMLFVSVLVIFGAFLTAFFHIIGSFKKELYEDRGYLTFTLPLTGNKILGAKLIVAIMWFAVLGIGTFLFNMLLAIILYGSEWLNIVKQALGMVNSVWISVVLISGLSAIMTLILIYFSMALSRVSIRNKKIGGLWFVIFLILNAVLSYIILKISGAIPYFINLSSFGISHYYELSMLPDFVTGAEQIILIDNNFNGYLNIASVLSHVLASVGAFLSTGYLIEKKIDL